MAQYLKKQKQRQQQQQKTIEFWSENIFSDKFISRTSISSVPAANSL